MYIGLLANTAQWSAAQLALSVTIINSYVSMGQRITVLGIMEMYCLKMINKENTMFYIPDVYYHCCMQDLIGDLHM